MNAIEKEVEITEAEYDEVLEEIYGKSVLVCGMDMYPPRVLKEMDPIAYRCGKGDYEDSLDRVWECDECGEEYKDEDEAEECCKEDEEEKKD